jgi:LmbE family N-acetylglucosaminyl deacetylase
VVLERQLNVLVISPHPDDEAIGCGGAIGLHRLRGDRVVVVFLTSGELGLKEIAVEEARATREAEARLAAAALGVANHYFLRCPDWGCGDHIQEAAASLAPHLARERPDLIYFPHPLDDHPDHRAALPIVRAALASTQGIGPELRGYEVWTPMQSWDQCENILPVMEQKLRAIRCYQSQVIQYAYDRAALGLAQFRGALAGRCEFAEVYCTIQRTP